MFEPYPILDGAARVEIKIKGSRFIGEALPVDSTAAAEEALAAIRKREYDATHHCSAWRIDPEGREFRFSDDGEPSGSAGAPILRQIEGKGLSGALVVVTRYYGGTKLGTGGLIRAYGEAAALALDEAPTREVIPRRRRTVRFAYEDTSPAMHTIGLFDVVMAGTRYSEVTEIDLDVRAAEVEAFESAFTEALSGRGSVLGPD
ncbi:MAG: YigZ family protein [Bacteroidetes bacterium]|nr:YigZ family protein [Bacteroidota bacterium]